MFSKVYTDVDKRFKNMRNSFRSFLSVLVRKKMNKFKPMKIHIYTYNVALDSVHEINTSIISESLF